MAAAGRAAFAARPVLPSPLLMPTGSARSASPRKRVRHSAELRLPPSPVRAIAGQVGSLGWARAGGFGGLRGVSTSWYHMGLAKAAAAEVALALAVPLAARHSHRGMHGADGKAAGVHGSRDMMRGT
jgi:hypothetical protein